MTDDRTDKDRLLDSLLHERYAPVMPPDPPRRRKRVEPDDVVPERVAGRPTGTGWPEDET